MIPKPTSPLAEAIELMSNAVHAHLNSRAPMRRTPRPASRTRSTTRRRRRRTSTDTASTPPRPGGAVRVGLDSTRWRCCRTAHARARVRGGDSRRGRGEHGAGGADRTWTWMLGDEPPGVVISILPKSQFPTVLPAGTSTLRLRATPVVLEPSWTVELSFTPLGGAAPTTSPSRSTSRPSSPNHQ